MILGFLVVTSVLVVSLGRLGDMYGRVFAAFLGYIQGRSFFPNLISTPFRHGLHTAFDFAIGACLVAAGASWFRGGGRYVHVEEQEPNVYVHPYCGMYDFASLGINSTAPPRQHPGRLRGLDGDRPGGPDGKGQARGQARIRGEPSCQAVAALPCINFL
jgi:hypothetical protein